VPAAASGGRRIPLRMRTVLDPILAHGIPRLCAISLRPKIGKPRSRSLAVYVG